MAYRIIHSPHWEGCTHLVDTRGEDTYAYAAMNNAQFIDSDEITGEMCFKLMDGRTAWITSTDIECVAPFDSSVLVEPYETTIRWDVRFITPHSVTTVNVLADDEMDAEDRATTILCEELGNEWLKRMNRIGYVVAEEVKVLSCEDGKRQYDDCPNHNQGENHG